MLFCLAPVMVVAVCGRVRGVSNCPADRSRWRWTRDKFVAVKVKTAHHMLARDMHEVHMQEKISLGDDNHPGKKHVRQMLDVFTVTGPHHAHICIVFEAMREPLWTFTTKFPRRALPIAVVKKIITKILLGLDYLHTQCKMIHGGRFALVVWTPSPRLTTSRHQAR